MVNPKQIEASMAARRASLRSKIAAVIDQMPQRFKATELYHAAGIPDSKSPGHRAMIASVLAQDFKCDAITQPGNKRYWRKPA